MKNLHFEFLFTDNTSFNFKFDAEIVSKTEIFDSINFLFSSRQRLKSLKYNDKRVLRKVLPSRKATLTITLEGKVLSVLKGLELSSKVVNDTDLQDVFSEIMAEVINIALPDDQNLLKIAYASNIEVFAN